MTSELWDAMEGCAGGLEMERNLSLVGEFSNLDPSNELRVVFIWTDRVDGETVGSIRQLRLDPRGPFVVVLFCGEDSDQEILALEAGADDVIPVGLDLGFLLRRLRAGVMRIRRTTCTPGCRSPLDLDVRTHSASLNGRPIHLSALEFRLLLELRRERGTAVTHDVLEKALWGESGPHVRATLKHLVYRLRGRLGDPARDEIVCLPQVGYMLK